MAANAIQVPRLWVRKIRMPLSRTNNQPSSLAVEFFERLRRTGPDDNRIIKVPKGLDGGQRPRKLLGQISLGHIDDHFYQHNNAQGAGTKPVEHLSAALVVD